MTIIAMISIILSFLCARLTKLKLAYKLSYQIRFQPPVCNFFFHSPVTLLVE